MENIQVKADFLRHEFVQKIAAIAPDTNPKWGKMNVQQMVEHMAEYVSIANGKKPMAVITEPERLPRMQGFLASEKTFPENTPNVLLPDTPPPVKHVELANALAELQLEIHHFFDVHEQDQQKTTANPFFGELNYEQQVQLLYKHSTHHLRQFGAME